MGDVLERFAPATRAWFSGAFAEPTAAQAGAWEAISGGQHALVVAPTGSGKTLAAFLWALDRLAARARARRADAALPGPLRVARSRRSPSTSSATCAPRSPASGTPPPGSGCPSPTSPSAMRSGDTPADERAPSPARPPDILITTPESLFLILTSPAREALRGVETVIVDEVHAVAGTKRGAHLALSLERLDALLTAPAQRIGLSATVRPVERSPGSSAAAAPVEVVQPTATKTVELDVVVPVEDMAELGDGRRPTSSGGGTGSERARRSGRTSRSGSSTWSQAHRRPSCSPTPGGSPSGSTPGSTRSRTSGETGEALGTPAGSARAAPRPWRRPARPARRAPAVLARAHHGSVSQGAARTIEEALKAGRLPAVVATSSLELGIDMGAVDLVVQVEAPPSVATGLQRVGRAGHQVGAVSRGVVFPKYRGDLLPAAVVVERMLAGADRGAALPAQPARRARPADRRDGARSTRGPSTSCSRWCAGRRPFAALPRPALEAVLDMLAGRYPVDEFAELRPRIVWDRVADTLTGRPGAQRLAVTSGGTIPDRGLFGVFLAGERARPRGSASSTRRWSTSRGSATCSCSARRPGASRTSRHDRVLVSPAPGQPGRLPFWKGDPLGRPVELGRAIGAFVREVAALPAEAAASA